MSRGLQHLTLLLWCAMMGSLAGCNAVGFVSEVIGGKPKIPAVYPLEDRPTLILVEDPQDQLPTNDLAPFLAQHAGRMLRESDTVQQMIPVSDLRRLRAENPDFDTNHNKWSLTTIGQALGAQQVIYIVIDRISIDHRTDYRPTMITRIKVLDVESGKRIFPDDAFFGPFRIMLNHPAIEMETPAARAAVMRQLTETAAERIARLFYEHENPVHD